MYKKDQELHDVLIGDERVYHQENGANVVKHHFPELGRVFLKIL